MKKSTIWIIVAILVVIVGVWAWNDRGRNDDQSANQQQVAGDQSASSTADATNAAGNQSNASGSQAKPLTVSQAAKLHVPAQDPTGVPSLIVHYSDVRGFEPSSITVSVGTTVRFVNDSSKARLSVTPDPKHTLPSYPQFNEAGSIAPGQHWDFAFNKIGVWGFGDYYDLDKSFHGSVTVTAATRQ